ncbi:MAG: hypothetical protein SFU21_15145, partial [Flavihumibacter sp.]|nr:hypothetical protein [Flavihumibacter sp.]
AVGSNQYRNPALKNRVYRPYSAGYGPLTRDMFTVINDNVNNVYGFDVILPVGYQFGESERYVIMLLNNSIVPAPLTTPSIIDNSYFIRNVYLANAQSSEVAPEIDLFIQKYEPELLKLMMGYGLYKEFIDSINSPAPAQKYIDLLFGVAYNDVNGKPQYWMGLANANKLSVIANYVYYHYVRNNNTQTTAAGETISKSEAASRTNAGYKATWAWNEMRNWLVEFNLFMNSKEIDYPLWADYDFPWHEFAAINIFGI